jgi:predicted dehydrogenase
MSKPIERRQFVQTLSAGLAAGMAAGGYFSSSVHGADSKKLGWALVGLGSLSTNQIAPGLLNSEHCKLTAIVTGTPKKEKVWADKYGVGTDHIYNYETFDKIANDDTVDVIYIVLPNSMHCEYVKRAAKAGKHVFCEKPMANTSQECREMIAACQSAQRHLGIGYRCQFQPHNMACIEFAQKKAFGDLRHIDAGFGFKIGDPTQWRLRKSLAGGGALMDVGIYALQACRCLTNEEPIEIVAQETKTDPVKFAEVDESINWSMKFPSGVMANCSTSYNYNGINRYRAYADKVTSGLILHTAMKESKVVHPKAKSKLPRLINLPPKWMPLPRQSSSANPIEFLEKRACSTCLPSKPSTNQSQQASRLSLKRLMFDSVKTSSLPERDEFIAHRAKGSFIFISVPLAHHLLLFTHHRFDAIPQISRYVQE